MKIMENFYSSLFILRKIKPISEKKVSFVSRKQRIGKIVIK